MPSHEPFRPWLFVPEIVYPYDPRLRPLPPPDTGIFECPQVQLCINSKWVSHLDGLIERLLFRDAWLADDAEIDRATGEIAKLLSVLKVDNMSCCCGNNFPTRINENGELEISYDGGITWVPYPQGDPRQNATLLAPLPGPDGDDKKCQAASNAVLNFKNEIDQTIAESGAWQSITTLIAALLGLLIFIGVSVIAPPMVPLLLAVAAAMLGTGSAAFDAAFTAEVYDTFKCILYCRMADDASFDAAAVAAIKADVSAQLTGIAATHLNNVVDLLGAKGLTNIARTNTATSADCAGCDCDACQTVVTFDLVGELYTIGRGNLVSGGNPDNCVEGTLVGGIMQVDVTIDIDPGCVVTRAVFDFNAVNQRPILDTGWIVEILDAGDVVIDAIGNLGSTGGMATGTWGTVGKDFDAPVTGGVKAHFQMNWASMGGPESLIIDNLKVNPA